MTAPAVERAAKAIEGAARNELKTIGGWRFYRPHAVAALSAALDPDDAELRRIVGDAYREGTRSFLDNISGETIGAINDALQDAGARAAIAAIKAQTQ